MEVGQRVRSTRDGQLGFIAQKAEGGLCVRLDRRQESIVPYHPGDWLPDQQAKLTRMQVARVAYEADRALRAVLGEYGIPEFHSLKDGPRAAIINGPSKDAVGVRKLLYLAVLAALKDE